MDFVAPCLLLTALCAVISAGLGHQAEYLSNIPLTDELASAEFSISSPDFEQLDENLISQVNQRSKRYISKCYGELGCFPNNPPWLSLTRMVPEPADPQVIGTAIYFFSRSQPKGVKVKLWPGISLVGTDFNPDKPTAFITHGFSTDGFEKWMHDMKNAYLDSMDANVFLVDWGKGAKDTSYLQAVSNTRIVGAELARFGSYIIGLGQQPAHIHAIGHSLGAHISGYFGKRMAAINCTIGRITGLDPAQPGFEIEKSEVKLNKNDAQNVDVIHTNALPFIPFFGFGMIQPVGHIDFYINGGSYQPGCRVVKIPLTITGLGDLANVTVDTLNKWIGCSHGRAYEYFTWSLKSPNCVFVGRRMTHPELLAKIGTFGTLSVADPIVNKMKSCTKLSCNILGFLTTLLPARGIFAVSTKGKPPFCKSKAEELKTIIGGIKEAVAGVWGEITNRLPKVEIKWPFSIFNAANYSSPTSYRRIGQ